MNIKKENLQKAYDEGCEDVRKVLKNLFPELNDSHFNLKPLKLSTAEIALFTNKQSRDAGFDGCTFMLICDTGIYKNKAFYLSHKYNWHLTQEGAIGAGYCLIPTKK